MSSGERHDGIGYVTAMVVHAVSSSQRRGGLSAEEIFEVIYSDEGRTI